MSNNAKVMATKAREVMQNAYAPYSKYHVGACVQDEEGNLYTGCNVENASYGLTNCAERSAIFSLVSAGKKKISAMAIAASGDDVSSPCGACRQVIREFAQPDTPIYLCNKNGEVVETTNIEKLLPNSFGPEFLN